MAIALEQKELPIFFLNSEKFDQVTKNEKFVLISSLVHGIYSCKNYQDFNAAVC